MIRWTYLLSIPQTAAYRASVSHTFGVLYAIVNIPTMTKPLPAVGGPSNPLGASDTLWSGMVVEKPDQYKWDCFIAHAAPERQIAEDLYSRLQGEFRVFLDTRSLQLGEEMLGELYQDLEVVMFFEILSHLPGKFLETL